MMISLGIAATFDPPSFPFSIRRYRRRIHTRGSERREPEIRGCLRDTCIYSTRFEQSRLAGKVLREMDGPIFYFAAPRAWHLYCIPILYIYTYILYKYTYIYKYINIHIYIFRNIGGYSLKSARRWEIRRIKNRGMGDGKRNTRLDGVGFIRKLLI